MSKLVRGIGINDADYNVYQCVEDGDQKRKSVCPFYRRWANMLKRCYSEKEHRTNPTYKDCYVCDEWLVFSNFKAWMQDKDWKGKHLDKDIILPGNKKYGPEFCGFVDAELNSFVLDSAAKSGAYPTGVSWDEVNNKYVARCKDHTTGTYRNLGRFDSAAMASEAWREKKHELACIYADKVKDKRIAKALRLRYAASAQ